MDVSPGAAFDLLGRLFFLLRTVSLLHLTMGMRAEGRGTKCGTVPGALQASV